MSGFRSNIEYNPDETVHSSNHSTTSGNKRIRYEYDDKGNKHAVEQYAYDGTPSGLVNMKNEGGFTNDKAFQYNRADNTIVGRHGGTRMAGDRMQKYFNKRDKAERYGDGARMRELDQKRNQAVGKYKAKRQARKAEGKQVTRLGRNFGKMEPGFHTQEHRDFMNRELPQTEIF